MNEKELVDKLKPGMVITFTKCLGYIDEIIFTGMDGIWICGEITEDTKKINRVECDCPPCEGTCIDGDPCAWCIDDCVCFTVTDCHPSHVTHINRAPVDFFLSEYAPATDKDFRYSKPNK